VLLCFTYTLLMLYYTHTVSEEMCVIPPVALRVQLRIARSSAGFSTKVQILAQLLVQNFYYKSTCYVLASEQLGRFSCTKVQMVF
jgi:hypothetical protein